MVIKSIFGAVCTCLVIFSFNVNATVITFEDVKTGSSTGGIVLGSNYQGFDWDNADTLIGAINYNYHLGSGYQVGTVSGVMSAFNNGGNSPTYIDILGGSFDFNGAYWTSAWDANQDISFEGWINGVQLYSSSLFSITNASSQWIGLNWVGIDRLIIRNTGTQWSMDNFTFNEASTIPIPSAAWLFSSGLLGLIGFARRKA